MDNYVRKTNMTAQEVNYLMGKGYKLFSITPVTGELQKNGVYVTLETKLIYHMIRGDDNENIR